MRYDLRRPLAGVLVCGWAMLAGAPCLAEQGAGLVVHEWGTFTSFSGSDGARLEYRPLVDQDLPYFVYDSDRQFGIQPRIKLSLSALQRMETPVTYFYTDEVRDVRVRVAFPTGLLTEFYPPPQAVTPQFREDETPAIEGGALDWGTVTLIPPASLLKSTGDAATDARLRQAIVSRLTPTDRATDPHAQARLRHYAAARVEDSALVRVRRDLRSTKAPLAPQGDYFEKFLFYRGLGNFDSPLHVRIDDAREVTLANRGGEAIAGVLLIASDGKDLKMRRLGRVAAGDQVTTTAPSDTVAVDAAHTALRLSLVEAGLFAAEADAMLATWSDSWFAEPGLRVFHLLPQEDTDRLLPLDIEPRPESVLRVMVGRLELMTPQMEQRLMAVVSRSIQQRAAHQRDAQRRRKPYPVPAEIRDLGRLAEPALVRITNIVDEEALRLEARKLLFGLRR